jgi:hypothetical protein
MRNEIRIEELPTKVINNKVLVHVNDIFSGFTTKNGIKIVNLTLDDSWGDSKEYNISEFVMRYGTVIHVPEVITKETFNYETKVEVQEGDIVYWNLISFADHLPIVHNKKLYLLVDYHELLARKRNDEITPINGYALFTPVSKEKNYLDYKVKTDVTDEWILEKLPDYIPVYDKNSRHPSGVWEEGDKVRILVRTSPFKLEGTIHKTLDEDLYACPVSYIICTC